MFCSQCGAAAQAGAAFCDSCGSPLEGPMPGDASNAEMMEQESAVSDPPTFAPGRPQRQPGPGRQAPGRAATADPRKQQLRALRLQLKQLRLELQQVNMQLQQIRNQHGQGAPFVPWGIPSRIYRVIENNQLSGPQQRKQQLQQQILNVEQQILALENQMASNQPF